VVEHPRPLRIILSMRSAPLSRRKFNELPDRRSSPFATPLLIAEPPRTPWDLDFQVFGFPVRIHPLFWLAGLMLGFSGGRDAGVMLVIWMVAFFSSILIHELGHALMMRWFGRQAHIVLYMMGGLAIEGRPRDLGFGSPWSFDSYTGFQPRQRMPQEQILISAAGPGIQFLLLGLLVAVVYATGGNVTFAMFEYVPYLLPELGGELGKNVNLLRFIAVMMHINLFWPIINLLPVLPLDGGQIAMQVLMQRDPWGGTQRALWLSVIAGAAMAVFGLLAMQSWFTMILFASLAASSYMTLQQMGGGGRRPW
jgi:stage IV sporulation protein FB